MSSHALIGNRKLLSWQVVVDGEPKDLFGPAPNGYLILTREGRSMAITTAEGRSAAGTRVNSAPGQAVTGQGLPTGAH